MKTISLIFILFATMLFAPNSFADLKRIGEDEISDEVRALLISKNYTMAAPKLLELSKSGHREASYFLGQMYVCGKGVEFSCVNSAKMFRQSFEDEEASIIDPIWATSARSELAWLHAACEDQGFRRDEKAALRLAKAATKFNADPFQLDTLAAALANVGRFSEAVSAQEKAISSLIILAKRSTVNEKTIDAFKQRLKLYLTSKPARFTKKNAESECNALP